MRIQNIMAVVLATALGVLPLHAEDRLWFDCKVNGQPVRLLFDTGATHPILFAKSADRLGLKYSYPKNSGPAPSANLVMGGIAEECELTLDGQTVRMRFRIFDLPSVLRTESDGALSWRPFRHQILWIDAGANKVRTPEKLPDEAKAWPQFHLKESGFMTLEIAEAGRTNTVTIDTGSEGGLHLAPALWKQWCAAHPNQKVTLEGSYLPAAGAFVREQAWADKISVGPLVFTDVPITEAHSTEIDDSSLLCVIGLTAMKQLQFVLDGKRATAYANVKKGPRATVEHNRLGAVFIPHALDKFDLIAHVATGSPAQIAGIRNGDVLLKINDTDVTGWHTNKSIAVSATWEKPAGTQLNLTVRRGQETNVLHVTLENILGPKTSRSESSAKPEGNADHKP